MITLRRDNERRRIQSGKHEIRLTFHSQESPGPLPNDFGILMAFDEIRLTPNGVSTFCPLEGAEIVTYVFKGALAQQDSNGGSRVVYAGEYQRMTIGGGVRYKETSALRTDSAHLFRIALRPTEIGFDTAHEEKRFAFGQRHNLLCVIASRDGRKKSIPILQDVIIFSSILDIGSHLVHEVLPGRRAWLHVIYGKVTLQDIILTAGDGVGLATEPSVSFTALKRTEILLVDLGPGPGS